MKKKYEYLKKNMLVEVTLFQDHVPLRMRPDEETGQTDKHLFSTAPPVSNTREDGSGRIHGQTTPRPNTQNK